MKMLVVGRSPRALTLIGLIVAIFLLIVSPFSFVSAQVTATPSSGGTRSADQIAWKNFVRAVTPAPGQPGKVAYETWASDQDIYVQNPCPPGGPNTRCSVPTWPSGKKPKLLVSTTIGHDRTPRDATANGVDVVGPAQGCARPTKSTGIRGAAANSGFPTDAGACVGEEVRRDRASFKYIKENNLWSTAGLVKSFINPKPVEFPQNALNVKADWIPVSTLATWIGKTEDFVKAHFYTSSYVDGQKDTPIALTSMHVSVKHSGVPSNWIWANFENAYTPGRCDVTGCTDKFGATKSFVPPAKKDWSTYGPDDKTPQVKKMLASANIKPVFNNYFLTGTQEAYGSQANPTLLSSPIIEPLNANVPTLKSSCISCHAAAGFQKKGKPNDVANLIGPVTLNKGYKGYDFMWGLNNAS